MEGEALRKGPWVGSLPIAVLRLGNWPVMPPLVRTGLVL